MSQVIVVIGNAVDGLRFIGPFESAELANDYAADMQYEEWVVAACSPPDNLSETPHLDAAEG